MFYVIDRLDVSKFKVDFRLLYNNKYQAVAMYIIVHVCLQIRAQFV